MMMMITGTIRIYDDDEDDNDHDENDNNDDDNDRYDNVCIQADQGSDCGSEKRG